MLRSSQDFSKISAFAKSHYDEETAYESYMTPEPGFQSGPGDFVDSG